MYYRINGAPFTVKNADEKQELINAINSDAAFAKHLICRGINAEQFTGKLNGVVVGEKDNPNKVYVFTCEGNFPTLKLYQRFSSVVYIIELPVNNNGQNIVEKKEDQKNTSKKQNLQNKQTEKKEKEIEKKQPKEVVEPEQEHVSASAEESDPFMNPFFSDAVETMNENQSEKNDNIEPVEENQAEIKDKPKKRNRKKKF